MLIRKYEKFLLFLLMMTTLGLHQVYAQTQTVSGKILDTDKKTPIAGVSVKVEGTNIATQTNDEGVFSIKAAKGQTLYISYIGFMPQTIKVTGERINLSLKSSAVDLDEVVVAMDIKRKPRELGYSVQTITGKEIAETQRENFVNSLGGRVAGLTVTPTNGQAGASSSIVLRGFNSASLNNQPLFIVDGVIVDNTTFNETSNGGSGIGLASDRPNRNNDYTNRIADLNPSDIQSVTVLKGPEATALYGSQASSGAIVITTKRPNMNGRFSVGYDNSFRMQRVNRFPQLNNNYSPGALGLPLLNSFTYFGPALPANTQTYDNIHNFFKTGFAQTHNVSVDFGKKDVGFRFSGSYFDQDGVIPNNTFKRINFRLSNYTKINKYIDFNPTVSYINTINDKPIRGLGGFLLDLYAWPVTDNAANYLDKFGYKRLLYATTPNSELIDNPFFSVAKVRSQDKTDRFVGTLGINIHPFSWLNIAGRFGYDTYKTNGYTFYHPESSLLTQAAGGSLDNYYLTYKGYNHTITATATKKVNNFSLRGMVGTMWQDYETSAFAITGNRLIDSTGTDSSNTTPGTRIRLLRNAYGKPNLNVTRQMAYFVEAGFGYKNLFFVSYTHRFEAASVFPAANRNYNYPGFSASAILSDIFPGMKKGNIISYAKLRASSATTARLADPYSNQSVFVNNLSSSIIPGYSYGFYNNNPNLMPEKQQTYEIGAEFKLFNNLISLEGAYYNTHNTDQISVGFRASYGTGFVLNTQNATESRNQGVEITMDIAPVRKKDWGWDIRFNFNHMWNNVIAIPASIAQNLDYYISDTWLYANARGGYVRNHSTTTITGYGYMRNRQGKILINPSSGLPMVNTSFIPIGDRNPAFTLGTINSIRYKNWSFNFLWDLKVGGDIFNATDMYLTNIGKSPRTNDRMKPRIVSGVLKDGLENTSTPTANNILITPYYNSTNYYGETTGMPDEEFIQKNVNWLRLRDITLNYLMPENIVKKLKGFKSLSFFITGNDLILFTNYNGADPSVNGNTAATKGVGAFGFDYGNISTPISVNIGLRAGF
ncbi:SusC/RagA family TonB-linked outer membrane protein [Hydrotalea sp.]|uniref:SusC/RagA family TonB-linked outer membrane protein n=1 Tax=Hydrotalea sp. TaxID=2881279 RepID=UPI0026208B70|nr:SusC/RagA family TonB-linked outer membrane protein [Hydrotalea sp.]